MNIKEKDTAQTYKGAYVEAIDKIMARCDDIELLDFIYQILVKSEKTTA